MSDPSTIREDAITIWKAGVEAVNARKLVSSNVSLTADTLTICEQQFKFANLERVIVVGFGKASGAMAVGFEQAIADRIETLTLIGQVSVPDGQTYATKKINVTGCRPLGENLPTDRVVDSTRKIAKLLKSAGPNDVCVCLISGGGSALLENPVATVSLQELSLIHI